VALALAVIAATGAWATPAQAVSPKCQAEIVGTSGKYADLQAAITAAAPGSVVQVKGTCTGTFRVDKDLTLTGKPAKADPRATLDGGDLGSVVTVSGASVTLRSLIVTNGTAVHGGGIDNVGGTVNLHDTVVTGNTTTSLDMLGLGGGIFNGAGGVLNLGGASVVTDNAAAFGGGIYTVGSLTLHDETAVTNNSAISGGAIAGLGGSATLGGTSVVSNNRAIVFGGGVAISRATLTLTDAGRVTNNTSGNDGGGILNSEGTLIGAITTGDGANVTGNTPNDVYRL
jgi:hypothetical protein